VEQPRAGCACDLDLGLRRGVGGSDRDSPLLFSEISRYPLARVSSSLVITGLERTESYWSSIYMLWFDFHIRSYTPSIIFGVLFPLSMNRSASLQPLHLLRSVRSSRCISHGRVRAIVSGRRSAGDWKKNMGRRSVVKERAEGDYFLEANEVPPAQTQVRT
jgi:hypothetical protein